MFGKSANLSVVFALTQHLDAETFALLRIFSEWKIISIRIVFNDWRVYDVNYTSIKNIIHQNYEIKYVSPALIWTLCASK